MVIAFSSQSLENFSSFMKVNYISDLDYTALLIETGHLVRFHVWKKAPQFIECCDYTSNEDLIKHWNLGMRNKFHISCGLLEYDKKHM